MVWNFNWGHWLVTLSWPICPILLLNLIPDGLCPFSIIGLQNHSLSDFFIKNMATRIIAASGPCAAQSDHRILIESVQVIVFHNVVVFPRLIYLRQMVTLFQVSHIYAMGNSSACFSLYFDSYTLYTALKM